MSSGVSFTEHIQLAQKTYGGANGCPFVHCQMEVRHSEKFLSVHDTMKQAQGKRQSKSVAASQEDEPAPNSSMPTVQRPPGRKQAKQKLKRKEGEDEYVEVLGSFVRMKTDEQKKREEIWKLDKELEERKVSIGNVVCNGIWRINQTRSSRSRSCQLRNVVYNGNKNRKSCFAMSPLWMKAKEHMCCA